MEYWNIGSIKESNLTSYLNALLQYSRDSGIVMSCGGGDS
jgi:hypothetical protein